MLYRLGSSTQHDKTTVFEFDPATITLIPPTEELKAKARDIRLLVLDIDGTIAGHTNEITPAVRQAIAQVRTRGIAVAIATGRMYCSALRFAEAIECDLPLVAYNGAWIQTPGSRDRLWHLPIPPDPAERILDFCQQPQWQSLLSLHLYIDDRLYVGDLSPETLLYGQRSGVEAIAVEDLRSLIPRAPTKVLALSDRTDAISQLLGELQQQYTPTELYLTQSVPTFFEACHPQVNKGAAVRYLAEEILGLQSEQVMAIGDNFNDREMLTYAGIGIAMGNAPTAVRDLASWVAPSVEGDGVAVAIAELLL